MSVIKVTVKWGREKLENVEVDTSQPGIVFKTQLFTLTGVSPERQKVMVKGGTLKDDADMSKLGFKEGQSIMMMGTAGELPKAPQSQMVFVEDMSDSQLAQALKLPAGLTNMGNTCYMNATLQCLRAIPELQGALTKMPETMGNNGRANLAASMRTLFEGLDKSGDSLPPLVFLQVLRGVFPQFAEMDNHGFMQQDAEECWGQIVQVLGENVPGLTREGEANKDKHFVEQYMSGELLTTMTCDEAPEEVNTSIESFNKLSVSIGAGVTTYMLTEIGKGLIEKIEKNSPTLARSAVYTKKSKISRLPAYLALNFVRFQWRADINKKAKILKKVIFPHDLDVSELCTLELQEKLRPAKLRLKEVEEEKSTARKAKKAKLDNGTASAADMMEVDAPSSSSTSPADALAEVEKMKEIGVDRSLYEDVGANVSGQYELVAVLTHMGRAADSGHYIGWVKRDGQWWKFDDDKVTQIAPEEIEKLNGGGDWHSGKRKVIVRFVLV
ncbi:Ubiquitin carboxyl-terminal hydrolase 14 [Thoreauomyces humboldtii]|nr:Ubiquitin carboxyl-terminal hydrolase 14 [Thoreauomyces humboldtii]